MMLDITESFMRNLLEYPITKYEVNKLLHEHLYDWKKKKLIGGTDGVILESLIRVVDDMPIFEFIERFNGVKCK